MFSPTEKHALPRLRPGSLPGRPAQQVSYVWQGQRLHDASTPTISAMDHGFTVGDGTFETLLVKGGQPFALHRHWLRLCAGCRSMNLEPPSLEMMSRAFQEVLRANQMQSARLRFTVTSGVGPAGAVSAGGTPTYVASATHFIEPAASETLITVPWTRNESGALSGIKSTSYAENVRALHFARSRGAGEAIFKNTAGQLCEGTGSNLFIVVDGDIYTPPLNSGCLPGITRELVLECAADAGIHIHESPLYMEDLQNAEEVFITSTMRGVQPVSMVDGEAMPAAPGPETTRLSRLYQQLMQRNMDP
jgi:branched-chain amino acid aminotransferase